MKVNQIVGEHKKGFRAKKYARKPINAVGPTKPQGPVGPGDDKKKVAEATPATPANVTVKPVVGAQEVDVNGQKVATTTDPVAAATMAQLAKDGKIIPATGSGTQSMEEGPETPYYVQPGPQPMAKTGGVNGGLTPIVASKLWTAITPEIELKAVGDGTPQNQGQGFRKVMLQYNNKQFPGLEGSGKIIIAPSDFQSMSTPGAANMRRGMGVQSAEKTGIGAPPMRESEDLTAMLRIAGLR